MTLYPKEPSWYTGENIDGKAPAFLIYLGGAQNYREKCNEVARNGYEGFNLTPAKKAPLKQH